MLDRHLIEVSIEKKEALRLTGQTLGHSLYL